MPIIKIEAKGNNELERVSAALPACSNGGRDMKFSLKVKCNKEYKMAVRLVDEDGRNTPIIKPFTTFYLK